MAKFRPWNSLSGTLSANDASQQCARIGRKLWERIVWIWLVITMIVVMMLMIIIVMILVLEESSLFSSFANAKIK